ncbi:10496_t:CDS:2, partial [Racocetra persica]
MVTEDGQKNMNPIDTLKNINKEVDLAMAQKSASPDKCKEI